MTWRDWEDRVHPGGGWQPMPVERAEPQPEPQIATRRDGSTCDIRRSLGMASVPAADEDHGVTWRPAWP